MSSDVRFMIVRSRKPPVEADEARAQPLWLDQAEDFAAASLEVAPGVRVKFLGYGDNMVAGQVVSGALIAVQREPAGRCSACNRVSRTMRDRGDGVLWCGRTGCLEAVRELRRTAPAGAEPQ